MMVRNPHLIAAPRSGQPPLHRWLCGPEWGRMHRSMPAGRQRLWPVVPADPPSAGGGGGGGGSCKRHALTATRGPLLLPAGITAPGLRALAAAIHRDGFCTFSVSAPAGERSAQSHCISIGKHLHAWELPVEGAEEAYAVDGTPGDAEKLLAGPSSWQGELAAAARPLTPPPAAHEHPTPACCHRPRPA